MTQQLWMVAGGIAVMVAVFVTKYAVAAIAEAVVQDIGDSLQARWKADIDAALTPVVEEVGLIHGEVTVNGGGTLKDRVLSVERQLEVLITTRPS